MRDRQELEDDRGQRRGFPQANWLQDAWREKPAEKLKMWERGVIE